MQKTTQTNATHLLVLNANREKHNNCHNRNNKLCQTNQGNVLCSSNTLKQTTHFALSCCRVQHSPNNTTKQHYLHHKGRSTRIICKTKQCSAVAMRFLIATLVAYFFVWRVERSLTALAVFQGDWRNDTKNILFEYLSSFSVLLQLTIKHKIQKYAVMAKRYEKSSTLCHVGSDRYERTVKRTTSFKRTQIMSLIN